MNVKIIASTEFGKAFVDTLINKTGCSMPDALLELKDYCKWSEYQDTYQEGVSSAQKQILWLNIYNLNPGQLARIERDVDFKSVLLRMHSVKPMKH